MRGDCHYHILNKEVGTLVNEQLIADTFVPWAFDYDAVGN